MPTRLQWILGGSAIAALMLLIVGTVLYRNQQRIISQEEETLYLAFTPALGGTEKEQRDLQHVLYTAMTPRGLFDYQPDQLDIGVFSPDSYVVYGGAPERYDTAQGKHEKVLPELFAFTQNSVGEDSGDAFGRALEQLGTVANQRENVYALIFVDTALTSTLSEKNRTTVKALAPHMEAIESLCVIGSITGENLNFLETTLGTAVGVSPGEPGTYFDNLPYQCLPKQ